MATPDRDTGGQSARFLWLYALAVAGGAVAYVPFLTILLPLKMGQIARGGEIEALSYAAFSGAIAASAANIAFGWASDISRSRKPWIIGGVLLSSSLLVTMRFAETVPEIIALIVAWQFALNMMLAHSGAINMVSTMCTACNGSPNRTKSPHV